MFNKNTIYYGKNKDSVGLSLWLSFVLMFNCYILVRGFHSLFMTSAGTT